MEEEEIDVTKLKYVLYTRKSTDDPEKQARSIKDQISECEIFALHNQLRIVKKITEKKSAKKPDQRPQEAKSSILLASLPSDANKYMSFPELSDLTSQQELKANYIPKEYYDTYRLVFTHYHIDKIIVRIGRSGHNQYQTNEGEPYKGIQCLEYFKQIQARNFSKQQGFTKNSRCFRPMDEDWNSISLPRGGNRLQGLPPVSDKNSSSQHLLN